MNNAGFAEDFCNRPESITYRTMSFHPLHPTPRMRKHLQRTPLILLFAALLIPAVSASAQDTIKRSFEVSSGGMLVLDIDRGNVEVETSSGSQVNVVLERSVDGASGEEKKEILERHEYNVERDGSDIIVESRFDQNDEDWSWGRWRKKVRFRLYVRVQVPREYSVDFHTGAGNVEIADVRGDVDGRTGAGNITLGRIDGRVDVTSGSGNVDVEGAVGSVRAQSGAGNITLEHVSGDVRAMTGAGNVIARISSQPDGDSRLESGAGNVTAYVRDSVGLTVDAHASVGSANCDYDLRVRGKWMSKSFSGAINGGGPDLFMRSGVGNVSLRRM